MRLEFRNIADNYKSLSQKARVLSEDWFGRNMYCPACGNNKLNDFSNNKPVADFFCFSCKEEFELKSSKIIHKKIVPDGAYKTMQERLLSETNPNLMLLRYDISKFMVTDLSVIPKQFFIPEIIKKRKPLASSAKRAGWIGCDIQIDKVPEIGKLPIIINKQPVPKNMVIDKWKKTKFLRNKKVNVRGWLFDIIKCIEQIGQEEFTLADLYKFENYLSELHPENNHIKDKIRQQLQILRNNGYLLFLGKGRYRLII